MPLGVLNGVPADALGSVNFLFLPVLASDLVLLVALSFFPLPNALVVSFAVLVFDAADFVADAFKAFVFVAAALLFEVLLVVDFEVGALDDEDGLLLLFVEFEAETVPNEVFDDGVEKTPLGSSFPRFWVI